MNTALKYWKEAATLILAAGHRRGADCLSSTTLVTATPGSPLDSRSHLPHNPRFDYDILMLQRSSKSGFMPNAYVFPGGVVDSSDFSSEWLDIFKQLVDPPNFGLRNVRQHLETRPPIFATDRVKLGSPIPGEVAFRICALRETFEESGVLLVVSHQEKASLSRSMKDTCASHPLLDNEVKIPSTELSKWRTLVNENPSNFIRMCKELQVLPNIWALHEWSNWLTPVGRYGMSRFDTVFFICCLKDIPHTRHDEKEIVKYQWSTPSQILQSFQAEQFWIAPPQFYELSRMCQLPFLLDLHNFSSKRATEGCEHWLPVLSKDDHNRPVSLLPGDKLYSMDTSGESRQGMSAQDCGLHRMVILGSHSLNLQVSITPKYNHLAPVTGPVGSHDPNSHL
ncbi:acyl-coenzyme A diphosphatase NUDT19 [Takifugu rubripes]|uniref:Acyl-coenzyme A diphosphatase NUDT19 n=1 Tax=Takifugu rubripes TaxID=31033 RepID=H2RKH3_TAKRU|nr:nucleoside diphosphate-linked moiety X motif 19 [Takifugu rubripes]|eukprot:XP_003977474.1 PREDICTED: nucleoside diphosphate-linked moiety X motif 19, mitochondrial [Takifugu rubripes]